MRINAFTKNKEFITTVVLVIGYVTLQFLANLTVAKQTPISKFFAIPVGSLLWAVSFTWIDLINDNLGAFKARVLVFVSIIVNIIMILWFELYIRIPGTNEWNSNSNYQQAIEFVFGGYWRIYIASILTTFISENTDITVFNYIKYKKSRSPRWLRSMISNTFSAPLDAILFPILAFYGTITGELLFSIILTSALYKLAVSYISIPILYAVKSNIKTQN